MFVCIPEYPSLGQYWNSGLQTNILTSTKVNNCLIFINIVIKYTSIFIHKIGVKYACSSVQ